MLFKILSFITNAYLIFGIWAVWYVLFTVSPVLMLPLIPIPIAMSAFHVLIIVFSMFDDRETWR